MKIVGLRCKQTPSRDMPPPHTPGCVGAPFPHGTSCRCAARRPKPQTLDPKPQTLNPKPQTLDPKPQTLNPKPQTLNPKP